MSHFRHFFGILIFPSFFPFGREMRCIVPIRQPPYFITNAICIRLNDMEMCVDKRITTYKFEAAKTNSSFFHFHSVFFSPDLTFEKKKERIRTLAVMINLYHFYGLQYRREQPICTSYMANNFQFATWMKNRILRELKHNEH